MAGAGLSFSQTGATPSYGGLLSSNPKAINPLANTAQNPVAAALNKAQAPNFSTNSGARYVPPPVLPTTPLKSTSVTHPDGTNVVSTYHAPDTVGDNKGLLSTFSSSGKASDTSKKTNSDSYVGQGAGGQIINSITGETASQAENGLPATRPITGTATTPSGATVDSTTGGLISSPTTSTNPVYNGLIDQTSSAANGNQTFAQNAQDITKKYAGIINPIIQGVTGQALGDRTSGALTSIGEGNAQAAINSAGNLIQGLTNQENQELTGNSQGLTAQNQQTTGLLGAANSVKPEANANYFGSPYTGGLVGGNNSSSTNTLLGSNGTGNQLIDNSLNNALNIIRNGGSSTDAMAALVGGDVAKTAFTKAMLQYDPNWSPTSSNAIAAQNMAQGQQYQAQAQDLSNALQVMAPVGQKLTEFMQSAGLDSNGVPLINEQINKFNAQSNPAAVATMNAAINDIRSYAIQILGSQSGANPTDVTNAVNSFDFTGFTPTQLNTFFINLNNLGTTRLSQLQSASRAGYGNNQTTIPASGITATDQGSLQQGGANSLNGTPGLVKGLVGATGSGIADIITNLAGNSGAAVAGGLAEKVLGL